MSEYPKGSYIVRNGERKKILEELGDIRFVSANSEYGENWEMVALFWNHIAELKDDGWKVEGEKWKPDIGQRYERVRVNVFGVAVGTLLWQNDPFDKNMLALGNVYPIGQGEAAAERVRKALPAQ